MDISVKLPGLNLKILSFLPVDVLGSVVNMQNYMILAF